MIYVGIAFILGAAAGLYVSPALPSQWLPFAAMTIAALAEAFASGLAEYVVKKGDPHLLTRVVINGAFVSFFYYLGDRLNVDLCLLAMVPLGLRTLVALNALREHFLGATGAGGGVVFFRRKAGEK